MPMSPTTLSVSPIRWGCSCKLVFLPLAAEDATLPAAAAGVVTTALVRPAICAAVRAAAAADTAEILGLPTWDDVLNPIMDAANNGTPNAVTCGTVLPNGQTVGSVVQSVSNQ